MHKYFFINLYENEVEMKLSCYTFLITSLALCSCVGAMTGKEIPQPSGAKPSNGKDVGILSMIPKGDEDLTFLNRKLFPQCVLRVQVLLPVRMWTRRRNVRRARLVEDVQSRLLSAKRFQTMRLPRKTRWCLVLYWATLAVLVCNVCRCNYLKYILTWIDFM